MKRILLVVSLTILTICLLTASCTNNSQKNELKPEDEQTKTIYSMSSMVAQRSIPDMLDSSDIVISGEVKKILESKWSNPNNEKGEYARNILQTDIIIEIKEIYKNNNEISVGQDITVRIDKGELDNIVVENDELGAYNIGTELLLMLSRDDSDLKVEGEDYYVVTGYYLGRFDLQPSQQNLKSNANALNRNNSDVFTNIFNETIDENYLTSYFNQQEQTDIYDSQEQTNIYDSQKQTDIYDSQKQTDIYDSQKQTDIYDSQEQTDIYDSQNN